MRPPSEENLMGVKNRSMVRVEKRRGKKILVN